ncbi:MAG: FAD-dependent oxidoreductase [Anaerolineaceae bacterium]|nr:FAD-dependent oxidoreductase [Anaerolineaceae bacterium]
MQAEKERTYQVAIVGAGPAGLYAAKQLTMEGVHVAMLNRDIKPGGLAEYGIYPDKHKMKEGLRTQFRQILSHPLLKYYGNVTVSEKGNLTLNKLKAMGFHAVLVTCGAQGTKWQGLPGEQLAGVYHAKDLVYHYNLLPPFSQRPFLIGRRVAIIGAGNVSLDIAHYLIDNRKVDKVSIVVRRGPNETKYEKKEMEAVVANLDLAAYQAEVQRVTPHMLAIGQDPQAALMFIQSALPHAEPRRSDTCLVIQFLSSPTRILGDDVGCVAGLEVVDNCLEIVQGEVKARSLDTRRVLDVDTVVFAIGDRVDRKVGLPVTGYTYQMCDEPVFPIDGVSYEAYDPETGCTVQSVFLAGWSRQASTGLVGIARKDGVNGAKAVLQFLHTLTPSPDDSVDRLEKYLGQLGKPVVTWADIRHLEEIEREEALNRGLDEYKYSSNQEMLNVMGKSDNPE